MLKIKRKFKCGWLWVSGVSENWMNGNYIWTGTTNENKALVFKDYKQADFICSLSEKVCEII